MEDKQPSAALPAETYPAECPSCRHQTAVPKSVSTVAGEPLLIRLVMNCQSCAHAWTVEKLSDQPLP